MSPSQRNKVVGAISAVAIAVALVDVVIAGAWDTAVVLGFALFTQLLLIVSLYVRGRPSRCAATCTDGCSPGPPRWPPARPASWC